MKDLRIRFQKTDEGKYISHLDVNRMFGRAINRFRIPVRYTEGFNPHAYLVFGPPLSVGFTGDCEILDITLTKEIDIGLITKDMAACLAPTGIVICDTYEPRDKISDIARAQYETTVFFEEKLNPDLLCEVQAYFAGNMVPIVKRTKRGEREINLIDLIDDIHFTQSGEDELSYFTTVTCSVQDNLNPEYITRAVADRFGLSIAFARYTRRLFLTKEKKPFY